MSSRTDGPNTGAGSPGPLRWPDGPDDVGAGDDDRARPAVVADGQVLPVGHQRLGAGPEQPAEVGRVVLGGVEVDVVGDLERQPQLHLPHRVDRAGGHRRPTVISSVMRALAAAQRAGPSAMNGLSAGAANTSSRSAAARSMTLSATRTPARGGRAAGREYPVRQVVQAEQRPVRDLDRAHHATPLIARVSFHGMSRERSPSSRCRGPVPRERPGALCLPRRPEPHGCPGSRRLVGGLGRDRSSSTTSARVGRPSHQNRTPITTKASTGITSVSR